MGWFDNINPLKFAADVIKEPLVEWQKRKTLKQQTDNKCRELKAEAEVKKAEATIEMAKNGQQIEADYDQRAQLQMDRSWKDEYLMLLVFTPAIMAFIPSMQDVAKKGFEILESLPFWYRIIILGIIAAIFGLRWLIAPIVNKIKA